MLGTVIWVLSSQASGQSGCNFLKGKCFNSNLQTPAPSVFQFCLISSNQEAILCAPWKVQARQGTHIFLILSTCPTCRVLLPTEALKLTNKLSYQRSVAQQALSSRCGDGGKVEPHSPCLHGRCLAWRTGFPLANHKKEECRKEKPIMPWETPTGMPDQTQVPRL